MNIFKKTQAIILITLWNILALSAHGSAPMTVETQYAYMEAYRGTPLTLMFKTDEACEGDDIHIHEFSSLKGYPSVSGAGKKNVKVINIYALLYSSKACEAGARKAIQKKLFIPSNPQHMTHFHIVFSKGLKLDVSHDNSSKK